MNAVRSEVEELKEKIIKLEETISQQQTDFDFKVTRLQAENDFLRAHVTPDVIVQLSNIQQQPQQPNNNQATAAATTTAPPQQHWDILKELSGN